MIELSEEKISVNLRDLLHCKNLKELWENETEAFEYGLWYPRLMNFINNSNLKKKNPVIYNELMNINKDTIEYSEKMTKLQKEYSDDGSPIGLANYILNNIEISDQEILNKIAFVLGLFTLTNLSNN